jgi:hypothetical protein
VGGLKQKGVFFKPLCLCIGLYRGEYETLWVGLVDEVNFKLPQNIVIG